MPRPPVLVRRRGRRAVVASIAVAAPSLLFAGCSAEHYRRDADFEVGEILRDKEERLFGAASEFTLEQAKDILRNQLLAELDAARAQRTAEALDRFLPPAEGEGSGAGEGDAAAPQAPQASAAALEVQRRLEERLRSVEERYSAQLVPFLATEAPLAAPRVLTLADAFEIAAANSRDYQRQKELAYLAALDLTFERYLFEARFGVTTSYDWSSTPAGAKRQRDGALTTDFSLTQQLASGGLLVFGFTNSLIQRFTGIEFGNGTNHSTSSFVDLSFSQPILRGAGARIVQEPLVQAERDTVYALRDFERFRQEFAVRIASDYYRILELIDQIENARRSYLQFIDAREQSEALSERGRRSQIQLDQAVSSELSARNSWIVSQRSWQDAIDAFKITLGLPTQCELALDPAELERLRAEGLRPVALGETHAIAIALAERLDHLNVVEQFEDAERRVAVAADDLRAALDVDGGVSMATSRDTLLDTRAGDATWRVGATLDLPVDKLAERNSYRRALIQRDVQARTLSLSEDSLAQDVRNALRRLAQLRVSWRIAVDSVEVAERRRQSTALTLRMGRIQIRDALDATDELNRARNDLTSALVDYRIGVYELWRDIGRLALGDHGIELLPVDVVDDEGAESAEEPRR